MFVPRPDAAADDQEWQDWLAAGHDFGQLIAPGAGRPVPVVVPLHFLWQPPATVLAHLARPNPVWAAVEENPTVLLAVIGDWAYVPAAWKAVDDEDPALGIPTSYFAAVQLTCRASIADDEDGLLAILRAQLAHFEPGSGAADPAVHRSLLPGIRGLRLEVTAARAKFKFGGNVDRHHREAVAARLAGRGAPGDLAARGQLLRRLG